MSSKPLMGTVGIEKIYAYPSTLRLDLRELASSRGQDPDYPGRDLMFHARSLTPPWEDTVTLAVNAAHGALFSEDREQIGLVIVGTESSLDFGKPIATYVHRFCAISPNCRTFETKHACYGGTAALTTAAHWIASGANRGRKALVITTDQSRAHLNKSWEYALGAGAVAMVVSNNPQFLALEPANHGFWSNEVCDTYRPTSTVEIGNALESVLSYLEALEGAYEHYEALNGEVNYDSHFAANVYHMPVGSIASLAHRTLLRRSARKTPQEIRDSFEAKTKPSLTYTAQLGGTYTSSVYVSLLGLIENGPALRPGDRIGVFSYGSGSCAEYFCAYVGEAAREVARDAGLQALLDARQKLSISDYESLETERMDRIDKASYRIEQSGCDGLFERLYASTGRLVLDGVTDYRRDYRIA